MEKMLVTQALNELKTLDSRIMSAIANSKLVVAAKECEKKVDPAKTKEEFNKDAIASIQSINDLIDRRERIKSAIIESNARTIVTVCGEEHTVAKVIDMKSSIGYKKTLLNTMKSQFKFAKATVNTKNDAMEAKIDQLVTTAFGRDGKVSIKDEDYDSIARPYRTSNKYSIVDPIGIEDVINRYEKYIEEFVSNVDSVLQVSNCITYIEF